MTFASLDVATTGFALALSQVDSFDVTDDTGTLSSSAGPVLALIDVGLPPVFPFTSVIATTSQDFAAVRIQNLDLAAPLTITVSPSPRPARACTRGWSWTTPPCSSRTPP